MPKFQTTSATGAPVFYKHTFIQHAPVEFTLTDPAEIAALKGNAALSVVEVSEPAAAPAVAPILAPIPAEQTAEIPAAVPAAESSEHASGSPRKTRAEK